MRISLFCVIQSIIRTHTNISTLIHFLKKFLLGHNVGPHLLPGNTTHVKNCANHITGSGNGQMNSVNVGVGNRIPQGNLLKKNDNLMELFI